MIVFDHVTKLFPTGQTALDDVSFQIDNGEFIYIVGESGAGKTTLMRLLTKEYVPTQGVILFNDINLQDIKKHHIPVLRREIGVVFQDYKLLFERTVAENIALAFEIMGEKPADAHTKVLELLELVGLSEKADFFPKQLSGGEAQRVSIARSLATNPKLLFADEPTGNLDFETGESIVKLFESINKLGTTILMATHNLDLLKKNKKREIHLHKGKIVKDTGKKEEHPDKKHKEHEKHEHKDKED